MKSSDRMKPLSRLTTVLLVGLILAGCAVGPDYKRPEIDLPPGGERHAGLSPDPVAEQAAAGLVNWWQRFEDPVLDALVAQAVAENLDIALASARVAEAHAIHGLSRAERLPNITGSADATRERTPGAALPFDLGEFGGGSTTSNSFSVVAALGYEIDLWGRLAREREATLAMLQQSRYGMDAVRLAVIAEVVNAYFSLQAAREQLDYSRQTISARERGVALEQIRFDSGQSDELALRQAQGQLEAIRAQLPERQLRVRQFEGALAVLLGQSPAELMAGLRSESEFGGRDLRDIRVPAIDLDQLPASIIERRPDIRAAEARLMQANAEIGVAQAARLPRLSLAAALGTVAASTGDLFSDDARTWSVGGSLFGPVLDFGRSRARIERAEALREQAELDWRATVQLAFNELRNALIAFEASGDTLAAIKRQVEVITRTEELAEIRYREGMISQIELLDAQRTLLEAELALSETRRQQLNAASALFKALGGGWEPAVVGQQELQGEE